MSILEEVVKFGNLGVEDVIVRSIMRPINTLKNRVDTLASKLDEIALKAQERPLQGIQGEKGQDGANGKDGKDGLQGKQGEKGQDGKQGKNGKDGLDGKDGEQGVSVVDVDIALDNHLVVTLSNGVEIDAGFIGGYDSNDIYISTSPQSEGGGGTGSTVVKGTASIDFGDKSTDVALDVSSLGITADNLVQAWVSPATTVNNTADNHWVDDIHVVVGNVQAGVGFTIYASCKTGFAHGVYNIGWVYN
jgi:hypothetical protein